MNGAIYQTQAVREWTEYAKPILNEIAGKYGKDGKKLSTRDDSTSLPVSTFKRLRNRVGNKNR